MEAKTKALSDDPKIDGVLVQLPLPERFDPERVVDLIDPTKDVDGLHPQNIGSLALGRKTDYLTSCTPLAVLTILTDTFGEATSLAGKNVTIIGRSGKVGLPIYLLLQ